MAMILKHDMSAVKSLNTLNKNQSALSKALKKASSGMKINGAEDGASEYAIGSKMDVMVRALEQDRVNSETGRNMIGVAEGGIQEIINNLRSMKEMAINAANDHNSDVDRAIIQKEFSSRMQTISDIAAETNYNGRFLLNGDYYEPMWDDYKVTRNDIQLFPVDGSPLNPAYNLETWAVGLPGYITPQLGQNSGGESVFGLPIDFSGAGSTAEDFDGQGFVSICNVGGGRTHGFASVVFTMDLPMNTAEIIRNPIGSTDPTKTEYRIGIDGASSAKDVEDSLYNALRGINRSVSPLLTGVNGYDDSVGAGLLTPQGHNMQVEVDADGNYMLVQDSWELWVYNGTVHDLTGMHSDKYGKPLVIHTGPKQNEELHVFINSMSPIAMGLNKASVVTHAKATSALRICDEAIDYALNEITRLGAYMSRLDYTKDNLVTAHENVTDSMSTIMDADMAATMAEFHKQNVLTQSAQFMLAQSNQNSSRVLSLLQ